MVTAVIIGSAPDRRIFSLLQRVLEKQGNLASLSPKGFNAPEAAPDFFLWDCARPGSINALNCLAVFKERPADFEGMPPPLCSMAVVGSDNPQAIEFWAAAQRPAITCGFSPRDTITLSSMTDTSAVVAIQRTIPTFDGNTIEPVELPIELTTPVDSYSIMCAAAVLAYSGKLQHQVDLIF